MKYCATNKHTNTYRQKLRYYTVEQGHPVNAAKVGHVAAELTNTDFLIAHGKSSFLKPDKLAKLKRDGAG